jgi:hypothetical protein
LARTIRERQMGLRFEPYQARAAKRVRLISVRTRPNPLRFAASNPRAANTA